jgi:hypothetical protein
MEFTAIVHGGENGFAAFPVGGTNLFDINASPRGYVDGKIGQTLLPLQSRWRFDSCC